LRTCRRPGWAQVRGLMTLTGTPQVSRDPLSRGSAQSGELVGAGFKPALSPPPTRFAIDA
jgi:hypothetical protein